jgi:hypothetical protein
LIQPEEPEEIISKLSADLMKIKYIIIILCLIMISLITMSYSSKYNENVFPGISKDCPKTAEINAIIDDAISIGAPTYNQGNHLGCYKIYEGAAYKIIHLYGSKCKDITMLLNYALDKSHESYTDTEKAWIMRLAFDKILGVPTQTK